jgi:dihydroorotase
VGIAEVEERMSRLLIKNGHLIEPSSGIDERRDVLIEDGRVAAIEPRVEAADADILDAGDCFVAPGFLDIHVHLREPGIEHAETIETGAKAAAAGGFTSVCCMPNTIPVNDSPTVTSFIVERARRSAIVNVFPIGAITKESKGEQLAEIGAMKKAGIVAISDDGRPVMNSRVMRRAMEYAASFGLTVIDHCEDLNLSMGGDIHEGAHSVRLGLRGIPGCSEDVMVARDIILSEATGGAVHIAHISTRNSIEMVRHARRLGICVTSEVTPHHFALTDTDIAGYDGNYKMKPPLRGHIDKEAVLEGLIDGVIDAIATDHAPQTFMGKVDTYQAAEWGISGLETALGALLGLVHQGELDLTTLVARLTTGPVAVLGDAHRELATLREGSAADIVLIDPNEEWVVTAQEFASKGKHSPLEGMTLRGRAVLTLVGGRPVHSSLAGVAAEANGSGR